MTRALTENNSDRIEKGKIRAKSFTWEKAAEKVMDVLVDVVKK